MQLFGLFYGFIFLVFNASFSFKALCDFSPVKSAIESLFSYKINPDTEHTSLSTFSLHEICRDLDQASMEAVVSLLAGLPLQPEEGDGVELMEAKSQLFLK